MGGYGRRQLFPFSDVDLLLLCQNEEMLRARKPEISAFLQDCWDSGLRVSQSVRVPDECLEVHDQNAELNISLLDQRFLAGDRPLFGALSKKFPRFVQNNRDALMRNLVAPDARAPLQIHRHVLSSRTQREGDSRRTARSPVRPLDGATPRGGRQSSDLARGARRPAAGLPVLGCACAPPCTSQAGRDQNQLTFDAQDALADNGDVAAWMREYYRQARTVNRAAMRSLEVWDAQSSALFAQFVGWRSRLSNSDFAVHRERVHFRAPHQLETDPELVLRLFEFVARHGLRLSNDAVNQLEPRLGRLREYFEEPRNLWPALNRILSQTHAPMAVRSMHETGVLFALFPGMEQIECQVVRDFYHRYTVDEHTLVAIQNACSAPADLRRASAGAAAKGRAAVRAAVPRCRQSPFRRRQRI